MFKKWITAEQNRAYETMMSNIQMEAAAVSHLISYQIILGLAEVKWTEISETIIGLAHGFM